MKVPKNRILERFYTAFNVGFDTTTKKIQKISRVFHQAQMVSIWWYRLLQLFCFIIKYYAKGFRAWRRYRSHYSDVSLPPGTR
jgi:HAE1 family hydrophobic/amphiphilic exporter-1